MSTSTTTPGTCDRCGADRDDDPYCPAHPCDGAEGHRFAECHDGEHDFTHDPVYGGVCRVCGAAEDDGDGPANDDWIARAYEAQADAREHRRAHDPHAALAVAYARGDR